MYKPLPGGSEYVVGKDELAMTVYLPPVGKVWNYHEGRLEETDMIIRSVVPEEQYWQRPLPPDDYKKKANLEKARQKIDPEYVDMDLQSYRAREWHRRLYGAWLMVNGVPTYLTGGYYFYLAHWTLDDGPPDFRNADKERGYFAQYCIEDPNCYGGLALEKRRSGKSFWTGSLLVEYTTRTNNATAGIQSKTGPDARKVFAKAIVQPFRKLIDFFRPVYDTSSGASPKKELRFYEPAKKGKNAVGDYEDGLELQSLIDFETSTTTAYDGQKLHRYMCDEVFKTVEVSITDRHKIVRPCLENSTGQIIGKAFYTSTVEDMAGHMDSYIELWSESDFSKRNKNGRTISGLYRYFTAAQDVMFLDKYGYPDIEKALQFIQNEIDGFADANDKASYIRKTARNWQEAFRTSGDDCLYNALILDERSSVLSWREDNFDACKLEWDDNADPQRVERRLAKDGKFLFGWNFPNPQDENNVERVGDQWRPKNGLKLIIGIDPYEHDRTVTKGRFSMGAAAVYLKYDSLSPDDSENFVCLYISRPPTAKQFFEDMIKLCHYFGCPMLFENTRGQGLKNHFKDRGYGAFMVRDAKGNEGVAAHEKVTIEIVEETQAFIDAHGHRVNFPQLLEDWKKFRLEDTEKFDIGMASGYALIGASRIKRRVTQFNRAGKASAGDYFTKFGRRRGDPKSALKRFFNRKEKWQHSQVTQ